MASNCWPFLTCTARVEPFSDPTETPTPEGELALKACLRAGHLGEKAPGLGQMCV